MEKFSIEQSKAKEQFLSEEMFKRKYLVRSIPKEYEEVASLVEIIEIKTPYAEHLLKQLCKIEFGSEVLLSEKGKLVADKISGGVIIDLGCGDSSHMRLFSELARANLYIGIDKDALASGGLVNRGRSAEEIHEILMAGVASLRRDEKSSEERNEGIIAQSQIKNKIEICGEHAVLLNCDMLTAIVQLSDNCASAVISSGIEFMIARDYSNNAEYSKALKKEIDRVLKNGGLLLNYHSDVFGSDDKFIKIADFTCSWKASGVYEKYG